MNIWPEGFIIVLWLKKEDVNVYANVMRKVIE